MICLGTLDLSLSKYWIAFLCLCLSVACSTGTPTGPATSQGTFPATRVPTSVPAVASVPVSTNEYLLSRIPHCTGIQLLEPFTFDWPDLNQRIRELNTNLWGYFGCDQRQSEVARFYREQMPKPPYNMQETNWIDRKEGSVGVFYNSAYAWTYLWVVPRSPNSPGSYVIIAQSFQLVSCQ